MENVKIAPTVRHPIVCADWQYRPGGRTVLIYGHYDVQPADPHSQWHSPPFAAIVHSDNLYGRGASDDKGQMFAHLKAVESYLQTSGELPVNVKCLFEGEEEIGSPNLASFLERHRPAFAADVAVLSDMPMLAPNRPAITYAMRGALSLELEAYGAKQDLHSGNFGGAVHNPLEALCEMIGQLHDASGRIVIPGFYDDVRAWSDDERDYMARAGPTNAQILHAAETESGWGEPGYTAYERITIRPALSVNGIVGGYQGAGGKAVIPAYAMAKLNFRLVPDQNPRKVEQLFRQYLARITPPAIRCVVRTNLAAHPVFIDRKHPVMGAAAVACSKGFGRLPVFLRSGGTIPMAHTFQNVLGLPTVLMGFALADDRMHAPNEKFHLPNFYNGIKTAIFFLAEVGAIRPSQARRLQETSALRPPEARAGSCSA